MTPPDDYVSEMIAVHQIDDATAEALLAGRPVTDELAPVAEVVRAYRRLANRPVRPSAELVHQMAVGIFTEPAETYPLPARYSRGRRRRSRISTRTAVAAVLGGAAAAVASVGTAGFAGVLPDPAQERFETVVETVTPYEFAPPAGDGENAGHRDECGPDQPICGEEVREDARDGGVDGDEIRDRARDQGDYRRPVDVPAPAPAEPGRPSDRPAPADPDPPRPDAPGRGVVPDPPGGEHRPTGPRGGNQS